MVELIKQSNIMKDGRILIPNIQGEIVKIYIKTNILTSNVRVKVLSEEFESILDNRLENIHNIFYPYNDIARPTPETGKTDYYYINGKLGIEVTGINTGEILEVIKIFYK